MLAFLSRPGGVKDNPQPLLPAPVSAETRRRRRVRPAFVAFLVLSFFLATVYYRSMESPLPVDVADNASAPARLDPELAKYPVDYRAHVFYYSWYGNPENNGKWVHWNHRVLVDNGTSYEPPGAIGSTFWPALGPYSSTSPSTVKEHFRAIRKAGIGTVCLTWWGRGESDENGERGMTDAVLPLLFRTAKETGLRISFHVEPYPGRTAKSVEQDVADLLSRFAEWGSVLEPVFFVYDSYLISKENWAAVLAPGTPLRRHPRKPVLLGLVVNQPDLAAIEQAGWDGAYTYFASHTFVWGSNPQNWAAIASWASRAGRIFVPSVGPGYDDERVRPWNSRNTRPREGGAYYDRGWEAVLALDPLPKVVSVTSWNEWHEGTQIEPAVPHVGGNGYRYEDYEKDGDGKGEAGEVYLRRTRKWIEKWSRAVGPAS
ncbi:mannosidase, endo-alpha [Hyaloraphidium curvatum]|nr:mannosidase, endo-alpha [Hyaloraphidium curvatum]